MNLRSRLNVLERQARGFPEDYHFSDDDQKLIEEVHGLITVHPEEFVAAGEGLNKRYSVEACLRRPKRPLRRASWIRRFGFVLGDLVEAFKDEPSPYLLTTTPWDWASHVLLVFWLVTDPRSERSPHLTVFQNWRWEDDRHKGVDRLVFQLFVHDWPLFIQRVRLSMVAAWRRGLLPARPFSLAAGSVVAPKGEPVLRQSPEVAVLTDTEICTLAALKAAAGKRGMIAKQLATKCSRCEVGVHGPIA